MKANVIGSGGGGGGGRGRNSKNFFSASQTAIECVNERGSSVDGARGV